MINIHPLLRERKSTRSFRSEIPDDDTLTSLFEAARWAASSFNEQPWRFFVGIKGQPLFDHILSLLTPFNSVWAQDAPILCLAVVKEEFSHNNVHNRHAWHDLGLAMGNLSVEATHRGIGLRQLAGFDSDNAGEWLEEHFPGMGYVAVTVTAIGYPGNKEDLPEILQERENAPRVRRPLDEIVIYSV